MGSARRTTIARPSAPRSPTGREVGPAIERDAPPVWQCAVYELGACLVMAAVLTVLGTLSWLGVRSGHAWLAAIAVVPLLWYVQWTTFRWWQAPSPAAVPARTEPE